VKLNFRVYLSLLFNCVTIIIPVFINQNMGFIFCMGIKLLVF